MQTTEQEQTIIDRRIVEFVKSQTVFTMAVVDNAGQPYCASCFYAFDPFNHLIIFKSDVATHHIKLGLRNKSTAGTILQDSLQPGKVKGVQFKGILVDDEKVAHVDAKSTYYKKYPFAAVIHGHIWAIELTELKFTDKSLGFGSKLFWKNHEPDTDLVAEIY